MGCCARGRKMKKFMDEDFLLETETAKHLYHDYAEKMPIIDYHCHLSPKEIYEDQTYENITQVWLYGDHYKWRQMRSNGCDESLVTGTASDHDKFIAWAKTLQMAIGNPLYHWSHLELKRYFDFDGYLCEDNAEEVWNMTAEKLQNGLSARKLIENSNVEVICTTDDPVDSLEWHKKIAEDDTFSVKVLPAWRPDQATNIEAEGFVSYVKKLEEVSGVSIESFDDLVAALSNRMDFFAENGCSVSDHGIAYMMYAPASAEEVDAVFKKRLAAGTVSGQEAGLTAQEINEYKTALLVALGRMYAKKNWVMQIHFGVQRNVNKKVFRNFGADGGVDAISNYAPADEMGALLNALNETDELPKTILYSLNPTDNAAIGTIIGCFQDASCVGKIQHGAAWWFNDHKTGMIDQMTSLANLGLLGNFVGMLTDSRSFLSYTRHEYFRRIMCNLIGNWVENGEYPNDEKRLEQIIKGIACENARRYFEF